MPGQREIDLTCVDADIRSGLSLEKASKQYGVPEGELRAKLQAAGLATAPPNGRTYDDLEGPELPRAKVSVSLAQVRADQAGGLSFKAIAEKRGCTKDTVYGLLRRAGLTGTRRKRGRSPKANGSLASGQANGRRTLPEVQPGPDRAQEAAQNARKGHHTSELAELDAILLASWRALSLPERLRRLLV
jgi:hypothetical protein